MSDVERPVLLLEGGRGVGRDVRGPALVSRQGFGVRYDLDPERGIIANPAHDLCGESIRGRILVFTSPKGGVAASWSLADLADRDLAPLAIVMRRISPIFVQGALFAGIPVLHSLEDDPCERLVSGDDVALYPTFGRLEVFR